MRESKTELLNPYEWTAQRRWLHRLKQRGQIAELARARKYQAGAGPMAASYILKP
jgi:hypothetical protein